jgi:hypothetical protein
MLENPSEPAASAGRGAFLIAGYYKIYEQSFIDYFDFVEPKEAADVSLQRLF